MPYKDKEAYNEYMRNRRKPTGVNPDNVNPKVTPVVNPKLLHRPNRMGANGLPEMVDNLYDPAERLYNSPHYADGTLRYLGPLSDGQVLDRLSLQH